MRSWSFKKVTLAGSMAVVLVGALAYATVNADAAAARPPGQPVKVTAVAGDASADISWRAPASGGGAITGFVVTAAPGGAALRTTSATSVHVAGLVNGRRYTFTVAAINAAGTGARSRPSNTVTPLAAVAPGKPRSVSATAGNTSATVTWKSPASDGRSPVTGYRVLAQPGAVEVTVGGDARTATVSGLANGTRYRFVVAAVNSVGKGTDSERTGNVVPTVGPPGKPASVQASGTGKGVKVGWQAGDDGGSPITGYEITASPGGATVRAAAGATSATVGGLRAGTAYVLTVRARNAKGRGPGQATAATRPDATVTAGTVVLSRESLAALTGVDADQTLTFTDAPDQVRKLVAGNVIVADVSEQTPAGLLRKVVAITTDGTTTTVTTATAALDDALADGGLALATDLDADDVQHFQAARDGVRLVAPKGLAKIAAPELTISLDMDLASQGDKKIHLTGSQKITPHVAFDASVHCCFHTDTHFTAAVDVERKAELTAEISKELKAGIKLGQIDFEPIRFAIGPVPVVIIPRMELTLEASGSISVGIVTSVSETTTSGVDITSHDSRVTARPINTRTTAFQPPTASAAAKFTIGPRVRLSLMLYGVAGPYVQFTVNVIDLEANTSEDHFITLKISGTLGAGFQLSLVGKKIADWQQDPIITLALPLYRSGPFMGVTINPNTATVPTGGTVAFTATVARSPDQTVQWKAQDGTITAAGVYTAPDKPGVYPITATSPANGLKPETSATVEVTVTAPDDNGPPAVPAQADVLLAGTGDYGNTNGVDWLQSQLKAAGYSVAATKTDTLPADLSGYGQIWDVSTVALDDDDQGKLIAYVKTGHGVYLTGERPCCESLNAADTTIVKGLVAGATDLQIGGLGDPYFQTGPVAVNPDAPGGLSTKPFAVTTWTVSAPGGIGSLPAADVLASADTTPVAAAWGPEEVSGKGRITLLMDINWIDPATMDTATAGQFAQNLALYLSGKATPPAAPAALVKPNAAQTKLVAKNSPSAAN